MRYILAANHTVKINVTRRIASESNCCQMGTPNGIRISITTGDVNGIKENTVEIVP
jgi:hypothetical protein